MLKIFSCNQTLSDENPCNFGDERCNDELDKLQDQKYDREGSIFKCTDHNKELHDINVLGTHPKNVHGQPKKLVHEKFPEVFFRENDLRDHFYIINLGFLDESLQGFESDI